MLLPPDTHDAIRSLCPDAGYTISGSSGLVSIVWADEMSELNEDGVHVGPVVPVETIKDKPSIEDVNAELERLTVIWESQQYARDRAAGYPAIGDQLDALFHAGVFPEEMAAKLQAVKDAHPKPPNGK